MYKRSIKFLHKHNILSESLESNWRQRIQHDMFLDLSKSIWDSES